MVRPLSASRSYLPEQEQSSWTPSKFNKYAKPMGMPTPPRPRGKEFSGRDTYNSISDRLSTGSFHEDRNESSSCYNRDEEFIGSARDYGSRIRDSPSATPSRSRPGMMRSMSEYDDSRYNDMRFNSSTRRNESPLRHNESSHYNDDTPSKYEIMGMKEQLKKNEASRLHLEEALENAISEKVTLENRLRDEHANFSATKQVEIDRLHKKYSDEAVEARSQLVETFKNDMMEMKSEWENAFNRLKEEADGTKRALLQELENASDAKIDLETRLGEVTAEYRSKLEEEKERQQEMIEDVKREKEEDLERMRFMYEEHLDRLKSKQGEEQEALKDEIQLLLEENEKVKVCYENLEGEMERAKKDLHDINMRCQAAVSDNVNYEKEVSSLKNEVDELLDENDKLKRSVHIVKEEVKDVKMEMERVSKENSRVHADFDRVNRELDEVEQDRNKLNEHCKGLDKKIETMQEERELETRYTEALVKQRDNMNAIIENCQCEIEELKSFQEQYDALKVEYSNTTEDLNGAQTALKKMEEDARGHLKMMESMKDELTTVTSKANSLQRERERYNATVKALKIDLRALHKENVGTETSLQEHMRILNEKWVENVSKLEQSKPLEEELAKSMALLDEQENARERLSKEYEEKLERLNKEFKEVNGELEKVDRIKVELDKKLFDYEALEAKNKEAQDTIKMLQDKMSLYQSMENEMEKFRARRAEVENELEKAEDMKKGLTNKLEAAYYDLEEAQREICSLKNDHAEELNAMNDLEEEVKMLRIKNTDLVDKADNQEQELTDVKKELNQMKKERATIFEQCQNEASDSFRAKLRHLQEQHADQDRRFEEAIEKRFEQEMEKLQAKNRKLESLIKDQKAVIDEKSVAEMKRRGEFAKLRQEFEIARSKEKHLETHVGKLEEHISKIVSDYESRLQGSENSVASSNSNDEKYKQQIKDLEKKLEVSGAAMKQLGKSSLLMEKENEKLKNDKIELKQKLKKLIECTEKFSR